MSETDQRSAGEESPVAFGSATDGIAKLSDEEFLRSLSWRKAADGELIRAARAGDLRAFCQRLLKSASLGRRATARRVKSGDPEAELSSPAYLSNKEHSGWAELLRTAESRGSSQNKRKRQQSKKRNRAARLQSPATTSAEKQLWQFLENVTAQGANPSPADLHGMMEIFVQRGTDWDSELLFRLWRTALTAAIGFVKNSVSEVEGDPAVEADEQLFFNGELPWRVGLLFRDIKGSSKVRRAGRKILRRELADRTDGDGTPHARLLPRLGYWLAALVRCGRWADRFGAVLWDDDSSILFNDLLQHAIRLSKPAGSLALSNGFQADLQPILYAASQLAGSEFKLSGFSKNPVEQPVGGGNGKRKRNSAGPYAKAVRRLNWDLSSQSDWADLACLRSDWETECDSLVVDYSGTLPRIDMTVLGRSLFNGRWDLQIILEGTALEMKPLWTAICWNSDHDGDYLELQHLFEGGGRVERQIWLSRTSHFALLADSITGFPSPQIEYTSRLPLAEGLDVQSDAMTRETRIKSGPVLARVFPLFLPQDRVIGTPGGCGGFGDELVLKHTGLGGGLYAPIVLDWHPARRRKPSQWRQMTITEDGRIIKGDEAAGFRVKVDQLHLLAYRKLQQTAHPHSVLGFQTNDETVIGDFNSAGDVTPLLLVE